MSALEVRGAGEAPSAQKGGGEHQSLGLRSTGAALAH